MRRRAPASGAYFAGPLPRILAHRGFPAEGGTGNSLTAFRRALDAGASHLETDVRASADGVAILVHDDHVEVGSGLRTVIGRTSWAELSKITLPGDEALLRLDTALELLPYARFNIDIKARDAVRPTVEAVRRAGALDRVLITSFSRSRRRTAIRRLPGVATSASAPEFVVALLAARIGLSPVVRVALRGVDALQIPERALGIRASTPTMLRRLRAFGGEVHVWTIDDADDARRLLALGVDGIVTDRTDVVAEVVRSSS